MSFLNNNSSYGSSSGSNSWKKPLGKKSLPGSFGSGDSYQRFLEYLEESGQAQALFIQSQLQRDRIKEY